MLRILIMLQIIMFAWVSNCFAVGSGNVRLEINDAKAVAMGNAFAGLADNPSAVYYNPAGTTQLKGKTVSSFGMALMQPFVDYENVSGLETQQRRQTFLIPHSFTVADFGLEKFVFGLGTYSSWGSGTQWADDSFSKYVATKSDEFHMDITVTTAYQYSDALSLAVGVNYDKAKINAKKKLLQPGLADADSQTKVRGDGWGYTLAGLYEINERHQFGLVYRSEIELTFKGKTYLDNLNAAAGTNYIAVFGDTHYETEVKAKATLPQSITLGYSYTPDDVWTFNLDVEWMDWSTQEQTEILFESENNPTRSAVLNSGNPNPRDLNGGFGYAVGTEYIMNDRLSLRGGYTYKTKTIPENNVETSLVDFNVHGISIGSGYDVTEKLTLDTSYTGWFSSREIANEKGAASGADIDGKYDVYVSVFIATLTYEF